MSCANLKKKKKGRKEGFLSTYQGPDIVFFFKATTWTPIPTGKTLLISQLTEPEQTTEQGFQEEARFLRNSK